jgi:hypothetical protein
VAAKCQRREPACHPTQLATTTSAEAGSKRDGACSWYLVARPELGKWLNDMTATSHLGLEGKTSLWAVELIDVQVRVLW